MNEERIINDNWGDHGKYIVPSVFYQIYRKCHKSEVNYVPVVNAPTEDLKDMSEDFVITGEISKSLGISGNSITLSNVSVSSPSVLNLEASKSLNSTGLSISGEYPKTSGCMINIKNTEEIVFKDMIIDSSCYNSIEISLSGNKLPKGILFENCQFLGDFKNNAISILGTMPGCTINIKNCYFQSVSNVLRLSNRTNTNCIINIVNCKCDKWDSSKEYQGLIICQDYTSGSVENEISNNLFAPEKIKINIKNFTGPNGKLTRPNNVSDVCGSKDSNQLLYVYRDKSKAVLEYSPESYPVLNIN